MRIVQLTAENVKKLKVVEITPKGNVVQLTGRNRSGKTSILDSIWWALGGKEGIQEAPIRTGETKARIKLDLGEFTVERKFTASGSGKVGIVIEDGAVVADHQEEVASV